MNETAALMTVFAALSFAPTMIFLLSRVSGWNRLSTIYPCNEDQPLPRKIMGYGVFRRWIGYNGALMVSSNDRGIYLFPLPVILSWCHKPIFIPWSEIAEVLTRSHWQSTVYVIATRRAPSVDFALQLGTFAFVRDNAARAGVKIAE